MGYNTSVLILNDCTEGIRTDPELGEKLAQAISQVGRSDERDGQVTVGLHSVRPNGAGTIYCNPLTVVETHHADMNSIVAFGGNCATLLGITHGSHYEDKHKLDQVRQLAEQLGYDLRKKRKRKR